MIDHFPVFLRVYDGHGRSAIINTRPPRPQRQTIALGGFAYAVNPERKPSDEWQQR